MFKTKYRIVTDAYLGFEAQFKPWWSPFWFEVFTCNTSATLEEAQRDAVKHANREAKRRAAGRVVKKLELV